MTGPRPPVSGEDGPPPGAPGQPRSGNRGGLNVKVMGRGRGGFLRTGMCPQERLMIQFPETSGHHKHHDGNHGRTSFSYCTCRPPRKLLITLLLFHPMWHSETILFVAYLCSGIPHPTMSVAWSSEVLPTSSLITASSHARANAQHAVGPPVLTGMMEPPEPQTSCCCAI